MTPHIRGPHRPTDGPSCPRYSVATNAALVRPARCLPPLLQLAAVVRGGAAPLLSSTNHGPGWGTSGPEQARGAAACSTGSVAAHRQLPGPHIQLVPTRTMANGDVQLCGTIQSDVCSAPPPPGCCSRRGRWPMPHYNRCVTHRNRYLVPSLLSSLVS
jgi:hypothetical protein